MALVTTILFPVYCLDRIKWKVLGTILAFELLSCTGSDNHLDVRSNAGQFEFILKSDPLMKKHSKLENWNCWLGLIESVHGTYWMMRRISRRCPATLCYNRNNSNFDIYNRFFSLKILEFNASLYQVIKVLINGLYAKMNNKGLPDKEFINHCNFIFSKFRL